MSVTEILQKQAAAIKAGSTNAIKIAESLEEAARLIREEQGVPKKTLDFKAIAKARASNVEKFASAMKKSREDELKSTLNRAGWECGFTAADGKETRWGNKAFPGRSLRVAGGHFHVVSGEAILQPATDVRFIQTYLEKQKTASR